MNARMLEDREKIRKDRAKRAVALAMKGRWEEAATINRAIVSEFTNDVEAYNRLGKALSELGRNRDARAAFQSVLSRSPNNAIAKKNLQRLTKLGDDETPRVARRASRRVQFLEESGKAGVTTLTKLSHPNVLRKLTPGDIVRLETSGAGLMVTDEFGTYIGQVEPRIGTRIARLMKGGNHYEATVTSAEDRELVIIIRETYKSPSQSRVVSFPSRGGASHRVYVPSAVMGQDVGEDEGDLLVMEAVTVKDWSNDDTEPGDDEAFSPVIHRIINSPGDDAEGLGEDY